MSNNLNCLGKIDNSITNFGKRIREALKNIK
jgi:hypothetical protein